MHRAHGRLLVVATLILLHCSALSGSAQTTPSGESHFSRAPEQEIAFQQGLLYYSNHQLEQAEKTFQQVVQADPNDAQAFYQLGLAQLDQNKAADSIRNFDRALVLDPTLREVHGARASAYIRVQRYAEAEDDLKVLEPDPVWQSFVHYMRGQLHYAKGELKEAAAEFGKAKALGGTESAPAGFYEGLTYLRMRELVRARSTFREASLDVTRDPTVAAASRQLDAVLGAQQRRNRPWEFQLTLGYEWDSNVIELGSNIPTPAGISNQSDYRGVVQPRGSYTLIHQDKWDFGVEGSGYFAWQKELNDFDTESYSAGPFFNYHITPNLYASARYGYNYVRVGHDDFLNQQVVTPQLTYIEPKFGYTSGYYQFQSRDFVDDPAGPLNRDGSNHILGIVQGFDLPSFFRDAGAANLELNYRFERQETDGSDFDGDFNSVGATIYTPLPVAKLRADVGINLSYDNYDNPNSLDAPPADRRYDWEIATVVGLTREIFRGCALRVDYSYTDHHSNVETAAGQRPYEFDRNQVGVRMIYSY